MALRQSLHFQTVIRHFSNTMSSIDLVLCLLVKSLLSSCLSFLQLVLAVEEVTNRLVSNVKVVVIQEASSRLERIDPMGIV